MRYYGDQRWHREDSYVLHTDSDRQSCTLIRYNGQLRLELSWHIKAINISQSYSVRAVTSYGDFINFFLGCLEIDMSGCIVLIRIYGSKRE